jgi:DNA replication and repair protein RecF
MQLDKIIITEFKNYERQELDLCPGLNWFTGLNGMGKTNFLDAVYYLCMTKSLHGTPDRDLTRDGGRFFRLEGHFSEGDERKKIVAKVEPGKQKAISCNEAVYDRLAEHIGQLPVVFVAPADASLVQGGSEDRRRFLDNVLAQIDSLYLQHLLSYNRLIKQRNSALKQMGQTGHFDRALLAVYDRQLLIPARYIFDRRIEYLEQFIPRFQHYYRIICEERELVDCRYKSQLREQPLDVWLEMNWEKDRVLQRTTAGIHRDDLTFLLFEKPLKRFASQGQMKSFVLALKLAQYDTLREATGRVPLLLLDDIFDKLDLQRMEQLIQLVQESHFGQVFFSDTQLSRVQELAAHTSRDFRIFEVNAGKISNVQ